MLICQGIQFQEHNAVYYVIQKDVFDCKLLIVFAAHVGNSFF